MAQLVKGYTHARIQRGDRGPDPPENHKAIGFVSIVEWIP